ncbi:MAG TPA: sigma-70 family RNA polymerase sigma factor [Allocoleopsis sp.]
METCLTQYSEASCFEQFWVLYWYKCRQRQLNCLATDHLTAYLQEACYWAARQVVTHFAAPQNHLADCFQIGITAVEKILQRYNPAYGSTLKGYSYIAFRGVIVDTLRQSQEVDFCSDWALLRKLSHKRFKRCLIDFGLSLDLIERYELAWTCFKALYAPTLSGEAHALPRPDDANWAAITRLYNTQRLSQLRSPGSECHPATLEQWLTQSAHWARSYLVPQITSLNQPKLGQESGELLEDVPAPGESLLTQLITQEEVETREHQRTQINRVLTIAFDHLSSQLQELLQLYYGQGLTQQQIAQQLNLKQYTVSRHLTHANHTLLTELVNWSQQKLGISLSAAAIETMSNVLEEWLQERFTQPDSL